MERKQKRKYPQKDVKILYGRAGGRCSICRREVILEKEDGKAFQIGKIAHIEAHSKGGPRSNPDNRSTDVYENWILLCPTCHDLVDNDPQKYTTEKLKEIKKEHEAWCLHELDESMADITFSELDVAAKALAQGAFENSEKETDFSLIKINEKLSKNKLSSSSKGMIKMGISRSKEVEHYLAHMERSDPDFSKRLKCGFQKKYDELRKEYRADDLFSEMQAFATSSSKSFKVKAAGLAILVYLFQLCEIFEK